MPRGRFDSGSRVPPLPGSHEHHVPELTPEFSDYSSIILEQFDEHFRELLELFLNESVFMIPARVSGSTGGLGAEHPIKALTAS